MEIRFANLVLERCLQDASYAGRHLGPALSSRYAYLVNFLACIDAARDLGRFAFLDTVGPPKAEQGLPWTVCLVDRWRLVFEVADDGTTINIMEVVQS